MAAATERKTGGTSSSGSSNPSRVRTLMARTFSDPWRKATSIVLAVLLWYFLDAQITKETQVTCELHVVDSQRNFANQPSGPDRSVLDVGISTREFSSRGFRALRGDQFTTEVTLTFKGPAHLIDGIQSEHFYVSLGGEPTGANGTYFEFDKDAIKGDRDLVNAIVAMTPARVALDVERNDNDVVNLKAEHVVLQVPPPDPTNGNESYEGRLLMEKATFSPRIVTLFATASELAQVPREKLFELDLRDRANDFNGREIKGKLKLLTFRDSDNEVIPLRCDTVPEITIPLKPKYEMHTLNVPVNLDLQSTEYKRDDFEPVPPQTVTLKVASDISLAAELSQLDLEGRDKWIEDNLRVLAYLPRDKKWNQPIVGKLIFLKSTGLVQGRDLVRDRDYTYEMLPITLKLKNKSQDKDQDKDKDG